MTLTSFAEPRLIVLDSNILMRCVLGWQVPRLLDAYHGQIAFLSPEQAFEEAARYVPAVLVTRGASQAAAQTKARRALLDIALVVEAITEVTYRDEEPRAHLRIDKRDPDDWHCLALSLHYACPIWTEVQDFFGTGVPTWTTDRVELYFNNQ